MSDRLHSQNGGSGEWSFLQDRGGFHLLPDERADEEPSLLPRPWPDPPGSAAYHGLLGELVELISPHSESDPVALLVNALVSFGSVIGSSAHFRAEADRHPCRLFAALVGETSKGRKGSSWGHVRQVFEAVDEGWVKRIHSGLSSGEGLIWAVRDPLKKSEPIKKAGRVTDYQLVESDPGVEDKRLLAMESELARILRVLGRDPNTLSAVIRESWDTGDLRILTKTSPAQSTGAHISIIGHVTREELVRYLSATEASNGFANRFLWFCVRRSKCLPKGGNLQPWELQGLMDRLRAAVEHAREVGELRRDEAAEALWHEVYADLSEGKPGLLGAVTSRAEAQVMRLAATYALLNISRLVRKEHLEAALALWDYSFASAKYIFGDSRGDGDAARLEAELERRGEKGMTRTEVRDFFRRNRGEEEIQRVLEMFRQTKRASVLRRVTGGRPVEVWFAGRGGGSGGTGATS